MSTLFYQFISNIIWKVANLIRHNIESKTPIEEAKWLLSKVSLIRAGYITLYNHGKETIILPRDYDKLVDSRSDSN